MASSKWESLILGDLWYTVHPPNRDWKWPSQVSIRSFLLFGKLLFGRCPGFFVFRMLPNFSIFLKVFNTFLLLQNLAVMLHFTGFTSATFAIIDLNC